MGAFTKNSVTIEGLNILAQLQVGAQITYTKIMIGDGALPSSQNPQTISALVNPILSLNIDKCEALGNGYATVGGVFTNVDRAIGFFYREIGLFAINPKTQQEVLYAYGNADSLAEWIPPNTDNQSVVEKIVDITTIIGNAEKVTATIDGNAYATRRELEKHNTNATAHADAFTNHNTDPTAHANGISGNAATATRLKPALNGSRNQCWLLCKLPKNSYTLVHYRILGAQYYDQYSVLEVVIKNSFGWCKYTGRSTSYQVSVKAYDSGTTIDVYLFAQGYDDIWEVFLQKNNAVTEFNYQKMGDATYKPTGTLVCDTATGQGMDGVELFCGKQLATIEDVSLAGLNLLKRNTAYAVGDIAYSPLLPSWARLECVKAGTTASTELQIPQNVNGGALISDGTAVFIIDDIRELCTVGDVVGKLYLPIGYVKANGATVQRADYPRLVNLADKYNLWTEDVVTYPALYGVGNGSTTFVLPDWRGVVMRYLDDGKGYDVGRVLGSYQADEIKSHAHTYYKHHTNGGGAGSTPNQEPALTSTGATGGTETRMKNISVMAVIRY